jgi:prepilin-type N-terminal cleavage/methylation domain-containing protein
MTPRQASRAPRAPHAARVDRRLRTGFTLVELLVVIAIIGMLMALLVPAVQMARESGRRATCMNNQKNLGSAVIQYALNREKFPPSFSVQLPASNPPQMVGWIPPMLQYIEQNALYQNFQTNTWPTFASGFKGAQINTLVCPSRSPTNTPFPSSYIANCGAPDAPISSGYPATSPIPSTDWRENGVFFDAYSSVLAKANGWPVPPTVTTDQTYIGKADGTQFTMMFTESTDALDWLNLTAAPVSLPSDLAPPLTQTTGESWWQGCTWDIPVGGSPPQAPFKSDGSNITSVTTAGVNKSLILNRNMGLTVWYSTASSAAASTGLNSAELAFARPSSNHPGGFLMTFCGGNTQFVSQDIEYRIYYAMMTPNSAATKIPGKASPNSAAPTYWSNYQFAPEDLNK